MTALVTIGLPVYNSQRFLRQSLDSLLAQTFSDFILIISDNASIDDTAAICKEYAARDSRVCYTRNDRNIGNPGNFNRVASLANTPYLKWSTADDFWAPSFLEKALAVMERDSSIALCYPQATIVDAEGANGVPYDDVLHLMDENPAKRFLKLISEIGLAHQHLGLIRKSALEQTHMLGTHWGSDVNLLAELALYGKFYELPERLFFRRMHKDSGSWKRNDRNHDAKYYHAAETKRAPFRVWPRHFAFFRAVRSSGIPMQDRIALYGHLTRRMIWDRYKLLNELRLNWQ